jgi:phosphoribosylformylglycinamidine synthase
LDENESEKNRGAVQEPNPFLKRHILASTYALFEILKKKKLLKRVAFKDLGAGGISGASAELVAKKGLGAEIDLNKIPLNPAYTSSHSVSTSSTVLNPPPRWGALPPQVIACAETQERMCWMVDPKLTKLILKHYNQTWALPKIANGACAAVIGKVTKGNYVLKFGKQKVCDISSQILTEGFQYDRPYTPQQLPVKLLIPPPRCKEETIANFLNNLANANTASREPIYEQYDKHIQGIVMVERDQAAASVIAPLLYNKEAPDECRHVGIAIAADTPSNYGETSAYSQSAYAVISAVQNVVAVGARPIALTDCLNYGNPEKPEQMAELVAGIRGLKDAAEAFGIPFISGNVSLYNESLRTHILPTATICCAGKMENYRKTVTRQLKKNDSILATIGISIIKNSINGEIQSATNSIKGGIHATANSINGGIYSAAAMINALLQAIENNLVLASEPIDPTGILIALARMTFSHAKTGGGKIGAVIATAKTHCNVSLRGMPSLIPKTTQTNPSVLNPPIHWGAGANIQIGFLLEIAPDNFSDIKKIFRVAKVEILKIGNTTDQPKIQMQENGQTVWSMPVAKAEAVWREGLRERLK